MFYLFFWYLIFSINNLNILIICLQESLPLLRQSVMLKEKVLDEVLPPQLNAQTTVILTDREKATVKITLFILC